MAGLQLLHVSIIKHAAKLPQGSEFLLPKMLRTLPQFSGTDPNVTIAHQSDPIFAKIDTICENLDEV